MTNTRALKERLSGKLSLPSLPEVVLQLRRLLLNSNTGLRDVGGMLAKDPPLAARVLRIANSAYYGLSTPVLDISHAATVLGLDALQDVIMQAAVVDLYADLRPDQLFDARSLWRHSTLTAQLMGSAPHRYALHFSDQEAFVTGLLHDIGKFVLFDHMRSEFADTAVEAQSSGRPAFEVETCAFGFSHADVGGMVAEAWGFPKRVVNAIGEHHDPQVVESGDLLTVLLMAADHVANETFEREEPKMAHPLRKKVVERLDLTDEEIQEWVELSLVLQASR